MATFAELAGGPAPAQADGTPLVSTITGIGDQSAPEVHVEYSNGQKTPNSAEFDPSHRGRSRQQMEAILSGPHIGVHYDAQSASTPFEIYDLENDPQQRTNLADSKSEFQRTMAAQVTRLRRPDSIAPRPRDGVAVAPVADPPALKSRIEWSTYCRDGSVAASPRRS